MKFFKTSLALVAALAILAAPAAAQYGRVEDEERDASEKSIGVRGYFNLLKSVVTGGDSKALFFDDPAGSIMNITDANYRETIFEGEYIVTFCSIISPPCADYFPTFLDAAVTMQNETQTTFATVWVEENPRLASRFFIPARLPYVVYAKDGDFRQVPYMRNDTEYLIKFIEEEEYQYYPIMDGIMSPYSKLSDWFEAYAVFTIWLHQYTYWIPKWAVYIMAGSISGAIFQFFSGGSEFSSDPSKYPHLNPDGTLKKVEPAPTDAAATSTAVKSSKSSKSSSSTKKRSSKKTA